MSELLPHLLRPWWLLSLPLLAWLVWKLLHRRRRAGRWQLLLPQAFHPWLLSGSKKRSDRSPWIYLGLAWLLAVLALLGPSWQRIEQPAMQRNDPLVVIVELTPEMLATDLAPSRMEQVRRKLLDLLQARSDAQTAIVVYAGSAHTLVPLSNDLATARNLLEAVKPSIMPEPGQRADLAVRQARQLLEQGAQGHGRLLLMVSSLDEAERQGIRTEMDGDGQRLSLLAIGTAGGAPIAEEDGSYLKDEQGRIIVPRLDEAGLRRFAGTLNAGYQRLVPGLGDLRALGLLDRASGLQSAEDAMLLLQRWADQGHWLLLPLLLLAACAGRRGWLFSLALLPALWASPQPANAFEFDDLWLRPDQQGRHLLDAGRPGEAASHFEDFRWRGLALYRAGDYAAAAQAFSQGDQAADHYNRGNALARSGELEAAIDAYDLALEQAPELQPALKNKALLQDLLRQRQESGDSGENAQARPDAQQTGDSGETRPAMPGEMQAEEQQAHEQDSRPSPAAQNMAQASANKPSTSQTVEAQPSDSPAAPTPAGRLSDERRQALEQWLRQIPDNPSELLRRKFWYQQQQRQENPQ
ncbi:Tetratricopeptide repeat protein [compost metagenome]